MKDHLDLSGLAQKEADELSKWLDQSRPPLAVSTAGRLFELFLQGQTCEQIHKVNKQFDYGAILHARVRDTWDQKRAEYIADIYGRARDRVVQTQLEAVEFVSNALAATHKLNNEKYLKFMQTGQTDELKGAITIDSLKQYKEAIESWMKLTGQDKAKEAQVVNVTANAAPPSGSGSGILIEVQPQKLDSKTVGVFVRRQLEARKKEEEELK